MSELDDWTAAVCAALDLGGRADEQALVLDVARDVAHGVVRPAAPIGAYLLGLAVGRGADPAQVAAKIVALANGWAQSRD
jgi:hypothetical protein